MKNENEKLRRNNKKKTRQKFCTPEGFFL